jgi:ribosomal protein S27E
LRISRRRCMSFVKCNYCKAYTVCLDRAEFRISTYILLVLNCLRCGNCVTRSVGVADKILAKSRYLPTQVPNDYGGCTAAKWYCRSQMVQPGSQPNGTAMELATWYCRGSAKWHCQEVSQIALPKGHTQIRYLT